MFVISARRQDGVQTTPTPQPAGKLHGNWLAAYMEGYGTIVPCRFITRWSKPLPANTINRVEQDKTPSVLVLQLRYGYATDYKKSVHAKCFLNSWYFRVYGMLFRLFSAIRSYSPLFSDQNVSSVSYSRYFLYSVAYPYLNDLLECRIYPLT